MTDATSAKKPNTTMTAIAHLGKDELPPFDCTDAPVGLDPPGGMDVEVDPGVNVPEAAVAEAEEAEASAAEDAEAADAEDREEATESRRVVSNNEAELLTWPATRPTRSLRTDGGKGGLWNVGVLYGPVVAGNQPVEGERDVRSIPGQASAPEPSVVDLDVDLSSSTRGIGYVCHVEYLIARVGVEDVEVDEFCLGPLGKIAIPCYENSRRVMKRR